VIADRQRGQASVELALALPLLVIWLLAIVQLTLIVRDQLAVIHAAREGARAAAVSASPGSAASAAARQAIKESPLSVNTATGSTVTVQVSYASRTNVPLVGALLPDITVRATATMQWEP
jgi:Flp pilus assembly protein TadG